MTSLQLNAIIDLQVDDLSMLSFGDDIAENFDFHADPDSEVATSFKPCGMVEIDVSGLVPVSDDDESISAASLLSNFSFHTVNAEEQPPVAGADRTPSFQLMVSKLNSMMMRSARSRAIISTTVFPDLKKKSRKISLDVSSAAKPSVHKANKPSPKHCQQRNHGKISTDSMRLGSRQDSCIGGFLRASKKW